MLILILTFSLGVFYIVLLLLLLQYIIIILSHWSGVKMPLEHQAEQLKLRILELKPQYTSMFLQRFTLSSVTFSLKCETRNSGLDPNADTTRLCPCPFTLGAGEVDCPKQKQSNPELNNKIQGKHRTIHKTLTPQEERM